MGFVINLVIRPFGFVCLCAVIWPAWSDDEYGSEWLNYYDQNGTAYRMNFSELPDNSTWRYGNVYFWLYTRSNRNDPESLQIPKRDEQMKSQYYNASRDTKVLTHGWLSSGLVDFIQEQKTVYLERYDLNVIVVDWSELANNPTYAWSAASTLYVGKRVAKLLDSLVETYNATGEQMHLVGHSLGAHVMGDACMFFKDTIFRVTGLDPARPLFEVPPMPDGVRLDRSDAYFVDIIHTAGGTYGYKQSRGRADYYPNGGESPQPGCQGYMPDRMDSCSHGRSHEYFTESIQDGTPFTSYPCEDYQAFNDGKCKTNSSEMGEPARDSSLGDYYLHTRNESKYAMGDESDEQSK